MAGVAAQVGECSAGFSGDSGAATALPGPAPAGDDQHEDQGETDRKASMGMAGLRLARTMRGRDNSCVTCE